MKCKLNGNEMESLFPCSSNCPLFGDCLVQNEKESEKRNQPTNADRINAMIIDEKAEFLSRIAYGRETPWSEPFAEKFCKSCPETKCEIPDYLNPLFLHECDFTDGKCPHGSDIVWWLQQPAENSANG